MLQTLIFMEIEMDFQVNKDDIMAFHCVNPHLVMRRVDPILSVRHFNWLRLFLS